MIFSGFLLDDLFSTRRWALWKSNQARAFTLLLRHYEEARRAGRFLFYYEEGEKLFQSLACITCHRADSQGRGPRLEGLFGRTIRLTGGATVVADADYIRESILNPTAKVVDGYQPIMPTFQGLVTEEDVMKLIAYIQSLQQPPQEGGATPAPRTP